MWCLEAPAHTNMAVTKINMPHNCFVLIHKNNNKSTLVNLALPHSHELESYETQKIMCYYHSMSFGNAAVAESALYTCITMFSVSKTIPIND